MIDESTTYARFGYYSMELAPKSQKKVVAVCDGCGKVRETRKCNYRALCASCARKGKKRSEEARKKISDAKKGEKNPMYGKKGEKNPMYGKTHTKEAREKMSDAHIGRTYSEETRKKMSEAHSNISTETRKKLSEAKKGKKKSEKTRKKMSKAASNRSEETCRKLSAANTGKIRSEEAKRKVSATKQGISYDDWSGYAKEKLYCDKFDQSCREHNREKYGRVCVMCGKTEKDNGNKLSVHHVDYNKKQGCEGEWKLVPLCVSCHAKTGANRKYWNTYLCNIIDKIAGVNHGNRRHQIVDQSADASHLV